MDYPLLFSRPKEGTMHPQSIKARSTPYPTNRARQRTCGYCGRTNQAHTLAADYYCLDCRTPARNLGWIDAGHTCTRCDGPVRYADNELCGGCNWNTGKGRNR